MRDTANLQAQAQSLGIDGQALGSIPLGQHTREDVRISIVGDHPPWNARIELSAQVLVLPITAPFRRRSMVRRLLPFALVAGLTTICLFAFFQSSSWRSIPQSFGLGEAYGPSEEQITKGKDILPDLREGRPDAADPQAWRDGGESFKEPKVDAKSPYPIGKTKTLGSNYTRTLVVPKMTGEDTRWIKEELGDMLQSGLLDKAVYAMDDQKAPLHPVKNKGNEVMAYLSYIIDHYDVLPDIAIFMHSHRFAWHNNQVVNRDASLMIRHLSPERVTREGYMNLRCHWDPGCPAWLHPGAIERIYAKQEEHILADSWAELFPEDQIPQVLGQPCCAQFAVSRERILSIPKPRFEWLRDWLLKTELSDYLSGRVFEYTWQYIFTASPLHCPSMSACYCDGYGLCFGDPEKFDYYFELQFNLHEYKEELLVWNEKADGIAVAHQRAKDGKMTGEESLDVPEVGRDVWLRTEIEKISGDMEKRRAAAFELGRDPKQRAKEAGREWKEGDGF